MTITITITAITGASTVLSPLGTSSVGRLGVLASGGEGDGWILDDSPDS